MTTLTTRQTVDSFPEKADFRTDIVYFSSVCCPRKKIPFEIKAEPEKESMSALESFREFRKMAESGRFPDLTLDEINEEIRLVREERDAREKADCGDSPQR